MSRYQEALEFLGDPERVRIYEDYERTGAPPCPTCGVSDGPCRAVKSRCRLPEWHPERRDKPQPRSEEEMVEIFEKLARKYARPYDPMESYGPKRYPR